MGVNLMDDVAVMAPPAVVSGATLLGLTFQDWVYVFTIIYTIIGIITLIKNHWVMPYLERKRKQKETEGDNKNDNE